MKTSIIAMSFAALLAFGAASAATTPAASPAASPKADTAQQTKMGVCAKANKGKKGDDYKNSMSACLKGSTKTPAAAPVVNKPMPATTAPTASKDKNSAQQSKMAACATANKGKTGDAYKSGMSACLKATPAASGK